MSEIFNATENPNIYYSDKYTRTLCDEIDLNSGDIIKYYIWRFEKTGICSIATKTDFHPDDRNVRILIEKDD